MIIKNKECMEHKYPNCPESNTLLQDFLFNTIEDFDDEDVIEFSQWTVTDWYNLTHHTETVNEYVNIVIEQLYTLTVYSYILKCQSRHLKKLKSGQRKNLKKNYNHCQHKSNFGLSAIWIFLPLVMLNSHEMG